MPQSKSIHFFATKRDLEAVIRAAESRRSLKYTAAGMFDTPEIPAFMSGLLLPSLGFAPSGDNNAEPFWLITDADTKVEVEIVPQRRGGTRYGVDPGLNPKSVVIWPGGVFDNSCLIAGQIGTGIINPASLDFLNLFGREFRQRFKRIRSFFVGPEAEQLLDAGYRLTTSVQSPRECDLSK
jgi:hypothetical protein